MRQAINVLAQSFEPLAVRNIRLALSGFFLKKMLGARYGPIETGKIFKMLHSTPGIAKCGSKWS